MNVYKKETEQNKRWYKGAIPVTSQKLNHGTSDFTKLNHIYLKFDLILLWSIPKISVPSSYQFFFISPFISLLPQEIVTKVSMNINTNMILRALSEFPSPLHYSLILYYIYR